MSEMTRKTVNRIPVPTWRFLNLNEAVAVIPELSRENSFIGMADEGTEKTVSFEPGDGERANIELTAEKGSKLTAYITLQSTAASAPDINIIVGEGAVMRVVFTAINSPVCVMTAKLGASVESKGTLEIEQFFADSKGSFIDENIALIGDDSRASLATSYLCEKGSELDLCLTVDHFGKRTESEITSSGALEDDSVKSFKGTIAFHRGSEGANGSEQENVLLLGDSAVNRTLPVLLCEEEDVIGTHGATVGDLSDDALFYFASRGITAAQARSMLKSSIVSSYLKTVENSALKERIAERTGVER